MDWRWRTSQSNFQFGLTALEPPVPKGRQCHGIRLSFGERLQDSRPLAPNKSLHYIGQLDTGLFQQRFQLVLKPDPVTHQVMLTSSHRPPLGLMALGTKLCISAPASNLRAPGA